jgi:hypothetical protein
MIYTYKYISGLRRLQRLLALTKLYEGLDLRSLGLEPLYTWLAECMMAGRLYSLMFNIFPKPRRRL